MFEYKYKGTTHTDTSYDYMINIGVSDEAISSIQRQELYEIDKKANQEREWRDSEMSTFVDKLNHKAYWGELTEDELVTLGEYRKSLKDYPDSDSFPFGDRPVRPNLK